MFKPITILLCLLFSFSTLAEHEGHGRDGGWPESINLLKMSKSNLLDLLAKASPEDVQEAMNGMEDRSEYYKPEDVNVELLKSFVQAVVEPDVIDIEKADYKGVRLFYYDIKNPLKPKIYATKNFFNNPRYQAKLSEISVSLIKEVQTLMLHEISHLWGFGEETPETNYAEKFASAMVNILHGSDKVNFSQKEKMEGFSQAYFHLTHNMADINERFKVDNKTYHCIQVDLTGDSEVQTKTFNLTHKFSGLDGEEVEDEKGLTIYRMTMDNYLIGETGHNVFMAKPQIRSRYFEHKGGNREVTAYTICHKEALKLSNLTQRMVAPYYSRSNLLTDLSNSSTTIFKFVLMSKVQESFNNLEAVTNVMKANQEQIIRNIDYKIKVQMKADYDWLIALKYKYSKDKDSAVLKKFNEVVNSDLSSQGQILFGQIGAGLRQFYAEVDLMKEGARKQFAIKFAKEFNTKFNEHVDQTKKLEVEMQYSTYACGQKRIGQYYECFLEANKKDALNRIELYKKMTVEGQTIIKQFESKLLNYRD